MAKAVALLSGGLDSLLAVKLMVEQGVDVTALNFTSSFCTCDAGSKKKLTATEGSGCSGSARRLAEELNIPIKTMVKGLEYMEIVRSPKHGYGKGINPCVDCRIYMFKAAKVFMEEIGADFIITGEVLGQRPMSQRKNAMMTIEKESGLEGKILRPLSAHHMPPTIAEKTGLVDRNKLMDISGRGRKPQMELAGELDINDYPCPSGGCMLTDKIFAKKVKDLLDHKDKLTMKDLQTLKVGRHFRVKGVKIVVSRVDAENDKLKNLLQDGQFFIEPIDFSGPSAIVYSTDGNGAVDAGAAIILRYSPKAADTVKLSVTGNGKNYEITASKTLDEKTVESYLVC